VADFIALYRNAASRIMKGPKAEGKLPFSLAAAGGTQFSSWRLRKSVSSLARPQQRRWVMAQSISAFLSVPVFPRHCSPDRGRRRAGQFLRCREGPNEKQLDSELYFGRNLFQKTQNAHIFRFFAHSEKGALALSAPKSLGLCQNLVARSGFELPTFGL
jgi:hypothetical protein